MGEGRKEGDDRGEKDDQLVNHVGLMFVSSLPDVISSPKNCDWRVVLLFVVVVFTGTLFANCNVYCCWLSSAHILFDTPR